MSDLIMFDFDGVIADSLRSVHSATMRALREHGLDELATDDFVTRLDETNWFEGLREAGVPAAAGLAIFDLIAPSVAAGEVEPYEGVREVLAALAPRHRLLIVTSNRSDIVEDFLSHWSMSGIDEVLGGDKGESKVLKLTSSCARYPHDKAWFVGDTVGDVVEGRTAGVATVAAAWGWHSKQQLAQARPDHVAHTPADLLKLLL